MAFEIYVFRLVIILLALAHFQKVVDGIIRRNNYNISDIEDQCHGPYTTHTYFLGSNSMSSSIKLRAYKELNITNSLYCHFNIRPPPGYSVVVNLEKFQLGYNINNYCSSAFLQVEGDNFKNKKFCGSSVEGTSLYLGKEARLYYYAGYFLRNKGFTLVATAYSTGCYYTTRNFKCANGNCIWSELVKDGVNNCGDNSDEKTIISTNPPRVWENNKSSISANRIIPIVIPCAILLVILIAFVLMRKRLKAMLNRHFPAGASNGQSRADRPSRGHPRLSIANSVMAAVRTRSTGRRNTTDDSPPPPYSIVVKEDAKNLPFAPRPPSYNSATSENFGEPIAVRVSLPPIVEDRRTVASNLTSADRPTPSAPAEWI